MRKVALFLIFIAALFCLSSFATNPTSQKKSSTSTSLSSNVRNSKSAVPSQPSPSVIQNDERALAIEQATASYTKQLAEYTDRLANFTMWLVIVGGIELAFLVYQLILLRRNIIDAGKASKATEESVSTMRSTAERELRAYLSVSVSDDFFFTAGQIIWARIAIKNCGQTPAYDVSVKYRIGIIDFPNPQFVPNGDMELTQSGLVIFPGSIRHFTKQLSDVLSQADRAAVDDDGTKRFYAYGMVEYTDAFDKRRFTNFRLMHGGPDARGPALKICNLGNDAN